MAATGELRKLGSFKLVDVHEFYEDDHDVDLGRSSTRPAMAATSANSWQSDRYARPA